MLCGIKKALAHKTRTRNGANNLGKEIDLEVIASKAPAASSQILVEVEKNMGDWLTML
jgi:hypothetical protein